MKLEKMFFWNWRPFWGGGICSIEGSSEGGTGGRRRRAGACEIRRTVRALQDGDQY